MDLKILYKNTERRTNNMPVEMDHPLTMVAPRNPDGNYAVGQFTAAQQIRAAAEERFVDTYGFTPGEYRVQTQLDQVGQVFRNQK